MRSRRIRRRSTARARRLQIEVRLLKCAVRVSNPGPADSGQPYAACVAAVDPDDDTVARYVVAHYRYDPDRRERRHVVVAAFDNPEEFHTDIHARTEQLRARRESGEDVDRLERITGRTYAAGYRRRQRDAHLLKRAIEHGVAPVPNDLDLPPNVSAVRAVRRSADPG
jgi:hypothetical protein